jgi:hypothetical protein
VHGVSDGIIVINQHHFKIFNLFHLGFNSNEQPAFVSVDLLRFGWRKRIQQVFACCTPTKIPGVNNDSGLISPFV